MAPRTSITHPIRVDWLPVPWLGRIGLTFAPGKKQASAQTGPWDRDLGADLARLRAEYGVSHLICLLEDAELTELSIERLPYQASAAGMAFHRLRVPDGGLPPDTTAFRGLVAEAAAFAARGDHVVVHCKGGLGRAGTFGGAVLRQSGMGAEEALAALAKARGSSCPETAAQRQFVRDYESAPPTRASRVAGAILGAAIGDALGHPTEFLTMAEIHRKYGASGVTGFELWWERDGRRFAPYTDDTQMAEIVTRALVEPGRASGMEAVMVQIAAGFVEWDEHPQGGHRAPGGACRAGARTLAAGVHWSEAGGIGMKGGGCGSVMRAYPFGIAFCDQPGEAAHWAAEHSKMTHREPLALAACAAMATAIALEFATTPPSETASQVVAAAARYDAKTAGMIETAIHDAHTGADPGEVLQRLQGWAAHEAIAAAMFVVTRHPRDIRAALLEGANTPGDSDSIATLVGAMLGARFGLEALPAEWIRDVERSDELLHLAAELAAALPAST